MARHWDGPALKRSSVAMAPYLAHVYLVCVGMAIRHFVRVINGDGALFWPLHNGDESRGGENFPSGRH